MRSVGDHTIARHMEEINLEDFGRPRKFPRRGLAETEGTNDLNFVKETTEIVAKTEDTNMIKSDAEAEVINADYRILVYALPSISCFYDQPAIEPFSPAEEASVNANNGCPSTSLAKPRRRPRKGNPRRAPLL